MRLLQFPYRKTKCCSPQATRHNKLKAAIGPSPVNPPVTVSNLQSTSRFVDLSANKLVSSDHGSDFHCNGCRSGRKESLVFMFVPCVSEFGILVHNEQRQWKFARKGKYNNFLSSHIMEALFVTHIINTVILFSASNTFCCPLNFPRK